MFSVTKPPWLPLSSESLPTRRYTAALDDSLPSLQFDSGARPRPRGPRQRARSVLTRARGRALSPVAAPSSRNGVVGGVGGGGRKDVATASAMKRIYL